MALQILATQLVIVAAFTLFGRPEMYLFLWLLPWLTVWKVVSATGMELALKERPGREPPATAVFTNRPAKKKKKKTKK